MEVSLRGWYKATLEDPSCGSISEFTFQETPHGQVSRTCLPSSLQVVEREPLIIFIDQPAALTSHCRGSVLLSRSQDSQQCLADGIRSSFWCLSQQSGGKREAPRGEDILYRANMSRLA